MKLPALALVAAAGISGTASAADIVAFGDSWLTVGRSEFAQIATERGLTVDNIAVGGTTTTYWAQDSNIAKVEAALDRNPDAHTVVIANGGNDAQSTLPFGGSMEQLVESLSTNTRKTLAAVFAKRPDISVVQSGYDLWAWDKSILCRTLGTALLSGNCIGGLSDVVCANEYAQRIHYEFVDAMDAEHEHFHSIDLHGSLQAAGTLAPAVQNATIASPNLEQFTPGPYFAMDCIHLSSGGYKAYYNALFDRLP